MKNETKKKIVAVAAGFGAVTMLGTFALVYIEHPSQWIVGVASIISMGVGLFTACTIDL